MPAIDDFSGFGVGLNSPATGILSITPSDTEDLTKVTRVLMVSEEGDVGVVMADGSTGILPGLVPGVPYAVRVRRVTANGTSATGIVGLV